MGRQGSRRRVAKGIYRDGSDLAAVVHANGYRRELRFPATTPLRTVRTAADELRAQLRKLPRSQRHTALVQVPRGIRFPTRWCRRPQLLHNAPVNSRVHPKYKTRYRVGNWPAYERALVQRGDVTLWLSPDAVAAWTPGLSGRPGGPRKFSDHAIETALILRLVFGLPLRQTEGFVRSVLALMGADLDAPDHTTLSRRSQPLAVMLRRIPALGPIHLIVDSTGLSIVGQGAWAAAKHGGHGKRGWKKLHLGVDRSGVIVAQALTDAHVDDATTAVNLIPAVDGDISSVTADAVYDTIAVYEAAGARGARVVVPPKRTAAVSRRRPRSVARDRTVKRMQEIGQRRWKKEAGYHRQARVENVFFRYKSIIGDGLRARSSAGQGTEAVLACNVLNRMTDLGRPASYAIQAVTNSWVGIVAGHVRFMQQGPIKCLAFNRSMQRIPRVYLPASDSRVSCVAAY